MRWPATCRTSARYDRHRLHQRAPAGPRLRPRRHRQSAGQRRQDRRPWPDAVQRHHSRWHRDRGLSRTGSLPRPHRHARLHRRAGCRTPRNLAHSKPRRCCRRRHNPHCHAEHQSGDRRCGTGGLHRTPSPRHSHRQHSSDGRAHQRPERQRDDRNRSPQRCRCRGLHRW